MTDFHHHSKNALKGKQKSKDGSNLTVCSEVLYVRVYVAYTINSQLAVNGIKYYCFIKSSCTTFKKSVFYGSESRTPLN